MSWKCYLGQPIEFKATYEGVVVKKDFGPDTYPVYGLKLQNLSWLKPTNIHIGKGFYVKPSLPHGITHYGPEAYYDLELVVTGPGLPATGKTVTFQWALSSCAAPARPAITWCKQFLATEVVSSKSGASSFTIEFISGYTEQQQTKGSNMAIWRICHDGPFELVTLAHLPSKWELQRIPLWLGLLKTKIDECGSAPNCEFNLQPPINVIDLAITELIELPVAEDQARLGYEIVAGLEQAKAELTEADERLVRSHEAASEEEVRELRAAAISHLERAHELHAESMAALLRFQEALERRR